MANESYEIIILEILKVPKNDVIQSLMSWDTFCYIINNYVLCFCKQSEREESPLTEVACY